MKDLLINCHLYCKKGKLYTGVTSNKPFFCFAKKSHFLAVTFTMQSLTGKLRKWHQFLKKGWWTLLLTFKMAHDHEFEKLKNFVTSSAVNLSLLFLLLYFTSTETIVDCPNAFGMSPLMIAAQKGYTRFVFIRR